MKTVHPHIWKFLAIFAVTGVITVVLFRFSGIKQVHRPTSDTKHTVVCNPEDTQETSYLREIKANETINLPTRSALEKLSREEMAALYHRYINNIQYLCKNKVRLGKVTEGGWDVCDDALYRPKPPCLVYSFGVNNDFSFEDAVIDRYGCEAHSFDHRAGKDGYQRGSLNHFHAFGIAVTNQAYKDGSELLTYNSILQKLGHTEKTISILKMSIDSLEWDVLYDMLESRQLGVIDNLVVEFNLDNGASETARETYSKALSVLKKLFDNAALNSMELMIYKAFSTISSKARKWNTYMKMTIMLSLLIVVMLEMSSHLYEKSFDIMRAIRLTAAQHQFVEDLAKEEFRNVTGFSSNHRVKYKASTETRHIGFLKVHKAGSTTLQNIIFRFGLKRNLTFVIPITDNYFKLNETLPVKLGNQYDILAVHSIYNKDLYDMVLPPDRINIAIVREPLERMISAAYYYRDVFDIAYLTKVPDANFIKELIAHHDNYNSNLFSETKNSMGKDFGFDIKTKETDLYEISKQLSLLNKEFKLVLVMERFTESLVLLKRYLNWKMSDIIFLQTNSHQHPKVTLTEEDRLKHRSTCFLDYAIYDFFSKLFDLTVEAEGPLFNEEVQQFETILDETKSFCNQAKSSNDLQEITASKWNSDFVISYSDCNLMKLREKNFISDLRIRHTRMNKL